MKSFLKKKWHRLPVGIITLILLVCLVAGSAFATDGFGFWSATAKVTVTEPMTVEYVGDPEMGWDAVTGILTADLDPNTGIEIIWQVTNDGVGQLKITPSVDNPYPTVTANWLPADMTLGGVPPFSGEFCLSVYADGNTPPGTYTFQVSFERDTP